MIVYASVAVSLDGYIDDCSCERLLLSNDEDWEQVRELRAECDAVFVGAETVRKDNPALITKDERHKQKRIAQGKRPDPIKVTISKRGDLNPDARFFTQGDGPKIIIVGCDTPKTRVEQLSFVATVIKGSNPELTATEILKHLSELGIRTLFIEGGTRILTLFLQENCVDYLRFAVAPFFVGKTDAPRFVDAEKFPFDKTRRMHLIGIRKLSDMAVLNYALKTDETDYERMKQAISLAENCPESDTAYSVGAVIVTRNQQVYTGYSRETSPDNHAEEEAIRKVEKAGESLCGATIYSTMEPCSTRKSKPHSCSALIIRHQMKRVVFAAYEPDHFVHCTGAQLLSEAGIEVNILEYLAAEALAVNAHIMDKFKS